MTPQQKAIINLNYFCIGATDLALLEAVNLANNALEKQIPKKPKISRSTIGTMWGKEIKTRHYACPSCKSIFLFAKDEVKGNCCKHCGQALDWSDTE